MGGLKIRGERGSDRPTREAGHRADLGGPDTPVFTADIGQHAAVVRARFRDDLEYLGLRVDAACNAAHAPVISGDSSRVVVCVIPTDEDLIIGRHTRRRTSGVETTTGPLGQGVANSVGLAAGGRWLGQHFNRTFLLFDFDLYALCGDGCSIEG